MLDRYGNASGKTGRILFLLLLLCPHALAEGPLERVRAAADSLRLAEHPTWRRLLHFEDGEETSSVLRDSFFLAPRGRVDPRAELDSTLAAYFGPGEIGDTHPRCRFPARYHWLARRVALPGYALPSPCPALEEWGVFEPSASISLLMVSGYLGNPASTFGHSLLKLNTAHSPEVPSLFEPTVNFGADIPQGENPFLYLLRGLAGGYEAKFSDKYFYTHDLVYSQTEFRDMWEYRLNLSEYQRLLLGLHAWEMVGQPYRYYFLGKNCGFRLAELVDLALEEEEILTGPGGWYAPVDLFHRLDAIDRRQTGAGQAGLIESVRYIPSARRKLFHELSGLSGAETRIVKRLLDGGAASISQRPISQRSIDRRLAGLPVDRQIAVLNGLLAFYHYLDTAEGRDRSAAGDPRRSQVLLARLRRPAQAAAPAAVPPLAPPTAGFRPMTLGAGAGLDAGDEPFALLNWSAYRQEAVGHNSLEGSELVVADVELGIAGSSGSVHLSRLEMVRLQNLNTLSMRVLDDGGLSWRLRIGVDGRALGSARYDGVIAFGAGRAWRWGRRAIGYGLVNVEGHTRASRARVRPEIKALFDGGRLRAGVGFDMISTGYRGDFRGRGSWQLLYRLGENRSLKAEYRPDAGATVSTLNHYF